MEQVKGLSPLLTYFERKVVLAAQENRIKELEIIQVSKKITEVVSGVYIRLGMRAKDDRERLLVEDCILKDLAISFPNLTLTEFELACYKGSMGDFKAKPDEVLFVSPERIHSWIKAYVELVKRDTIAKQREFEAKNQKFEKPSFEAIQKIESEFVIRIHEAFDDYLKLGQYTHHEPADKVYDYLSQKNLLKLSKDRKKEIFKSVEEDVKNKKRAKGDTSGLMDIFNRTKSAKAKLIIEAKRKAIDLLFSEIKLSGRTLKDFMANDIKQA